jgi:aryl-alcohol dehydrogenase-like predicted oxidoreductase
MEKYPSIALGTWSWGTGTAGGDQVFGNNLDANSLKPVFDAAMQSGLYLWDTAAVYGLGSSESILGEFVKQYNNREEVILSTKFTPQIAGASADPVAEMLEGSFNRLGTDHVDIYWIHNPNEAPKWVPGLIPLLKSGKVKRVGVSNHNREQIQEADSILAKEGFRISAVQNHYSLLYRSSEEAGIIDYCKENDITFFSYMVLEQGVLTGKYNVANPLPEGSGRAASYNDVLPQLEQLVVVMGQIGKSKKASVAQIAIAYAISKHTTPIIGVTKVAQVEEAAGAASIKLSDQEIAQLEALAAKAGVNTKGSWENAMI